jgi:hypothetical protein
MTGFKKEFWEFKYYNMVIQVKTLGGLKRLGELCELNGYNKKLLKDWSNTYISGNETLRSMVQKKNYPVIRFTTLHHVRSLFRMPNEIGPDKDKELLLPGINWYTTLQYESTYKSEIEKKHIFAVFEDVENLDDEAFQLWKELN